MLGNAAAADDTHQRHNVAQRRKARESNLRNDFIISAPHLIGPKTNTLAMQAIRTQRFRFSPYSRSTQGLKPTAAGRHSFAAFYTAESDRIGSNPPSIHTNPPSSSIFIRTISFYLSGAYTHSIWYGGNIARSYCTLYEAYMVGNRLFSPVKSIFRQK